MLRPNTAAVRTSAPVRANGSTTFPAAFATPNPFKIDLLRLKLLALHLLVIAYVALGWMAETRLALFLYVLLLPTIGLQWLFNRGSSVINNWETQLRTGKWRDARNEQEGRFLLNIVNGIGIPASAAQVNTVVFFTMLMCWFAGFFRMMIFLT